MDVFSSSISTFEIYLYFRWHFYCLEVVIGNYKIIIEYKSLFLYYLSGCC